MIYFMQKYLVITEPNNQKIHDRSLQRGTKRVGTSICLRAQFPGIDNIW